MPIDLDAALEDPEVPERMREEIRKMKDDYAVLVYEDDEYTVYRGQSDATWVMGHDQTQPGGFWNHRLPSDAENLDAIFWSEAGKEDIRELMGLHDGWFRVVGDLRAKKTKSWDGYWDDKRSAERKRQFNRYLSRKFDFLDNGGTRHTASAAFNTVLVLWLALWLHGQTFAGVFWGGVGWIGLAILQAISDSWLTPFSVAIFTIAYGSFRLKDERSWDHKVRSEQAHIESEMSRESVRLGSHVIVFENTHIFEEQESTGMRTTRTTYKFLTNGEVTFLHEEHEPVVENLDPGLYEFDLMERHRSQREEQAELSMTSGDELSSDEVERLRNQIQRAAEAMAEDFDDRPAHWFTDEETTWEN